LPSTSAGASTLPPAVAGGVTPWLAAAAMTSLLYLIAIGAALAALDQGELITIPSLPDPADWAALDGARAQLGPNLSRRHAAVRYKTLAAAA
jgi:hypothetical protein